MFFRLVIAISHTSSSFGRPPHDRILGMGAKMIAIIGSQSPRVSKGKITLRSIETL